MEFTKKILSDFGLASEIPSFEYHEIDGDVFDQLSMTVIKQLIPKLGKQIKFLNKYKQYLKIVISNEDKYNEYVSKYLTESNFHATLTFPTSTANSFFETEEITWQSAIKRGTLGRAVLAAFEKNSPTKRQDLANFVIDMELEKDPNKRVDDQRLEELANTIVQMFPEESKETYFTQSATQSQPSVPPHGLLHAIYKYKRAKYIRLGLIRRTPKDDEEAMEKYQNLIPSSSQNSRQFEEQVGLSIIPRQTTDEAKERELEVSSVNVLEDSTEEQTDWQSLIATSTRGRIILVAFEKDAPNRQKDLANFIVDLELDKDTNKMISYQRLDDLATSIVEMFPSERKNLYFVPPVRNVVNKFPARGLLYCLYRSKRKEYVRLGLVEDHTFDELPSYVSQNVLPQNQQMFPDAEQEQETWQSLIYKRTQGRYVLAAFQHNIPSKKTDLVKFIVDIEMETDCNKTFSTQRFEELAVSIVEMFPGEKKETYFNRAMRMSNGRYPPRGALYDMVQNKRKKFIKLGLLERKINRPTANADEDSFHQTNDGTSDGDDAPQSKSAEALKRRNQDCSQASEQKRRNDNTYLVYVAAGQPEKGESKRSQVWLKEEAIEWEDSLDAAEFLSVQNDNEGNPAS